MKLTYLCACGHGAELHSMAWRMNGKPRRTRCWRCSEVVRYHALEASPLRAAWHEVWASPFEAIGGLVVMALLCEGLLSGWLGRLIGAAAVIVDAL